MLSGTNNGVCYIFQFWIPENGVWPSLDFQQYQSNNFLAGHLPHWLSKQPSNESFCNAYRYHTYGRNKLPVVCPDSTCTLSQSASACGHFEPLIVECSKICCNLPVCRDRDCSLACASESCWTSYFQLVTTWNPTHLPTEWELELRYFLISWGLNLLASLGAWTTSKRKHRSWKLLSQMLCIDIWTFRFALLVFPFCYALEIGVRDNDKPKVICHKIWKLNTEQIACKVSFSFWDDLPCIERLIRQLATMRQA